MEASKEKKVVDPSLLYTSEEVSRLLKTNREKIYALIDKGLLRTTKIGRRKVTQEALTSFLTNFDGIDVDALLSLIPDGWKLEDLVAKGVFGKNVKDFPSKSELKKFILQSTPEKVERLIDERTIPPFAAKKSQDSFLYSEAERRQMARKMSQPK